MSTTASGWDAGTDGADLSRLTAPSTARFFKVYCDGPAAYASVSGTGT